MRSVNIFYYLPNNIKCHDTYEGEMGGECSTPWEMRYSYLILAGRPQWKRSLGRSKCLSEDNIKMDLKINYEGRD
jgi:hypothetical protein